MSFTKRSYLILPLALGLLASPGAESPKPEADAEIPLLPELAVPIPDSAGSASPHFRPIASFAVDSLGTLGSELFRLRRDRPYPRREARFPGTIHIVPLRPGIDFKIRIAKVPEHIDPGIFAPAK